MCWPEDSKKLPLRGSWRAVASLRGFVLRQASSPSPSLLRKSTSPKGRGSGETTNSALEPETIPLCQGLSPWESWQARQGLTERARMLPAIFDPFFHKHFGRCGKTARRVYLFAQKRGKINCKIRKCALRQVCRAGRTSTAHPQDGCAERMQYAGIDHCRHRNAPRGGRHCCGAPVRRRELCCGCPGVPPGKPGKKSGRS